MTKREFMLQATINGFRCVTPTTSFGVGAWIVQQAEQAWKEIEAIRVLDEARERQALRAQAEDRV